MFMKSSILEKASGYLNEMLAAIENALGKSAIKKILPMQPGDVQKPMPILQKRRH
jgi:UDP-glucuronate 4-epimerase